MTARFGGTGKPAWKEDDRNQHEWDFSHPFNFKHLLCKDEGAEEGGWGLFRAVLTRPHLAGASLHAYFVTVMSTSGCHLDVSSGWGTSGSHPVYGLSNGLQTHYQQSCVATEPRSFTPHFPCVSCNARRHGVRATGCVGFVVHVSACAQQNAECKVAALKAWLIWFFHCGTFRKKVEAKWLATQFTDLNFTTRQGITLKDTAAVYSPVYGGETAITAMSFCSTFLSAAPTAVSH